MKKLNKSFTLIEAIVGVAIFGLVSVAVTVLIISAQQSSARQTVKETLLQETRWVLQLISNELRDGPSTDYPYFSECVIIDRDGDRLQFVRDTDRDAEYSDVSVWYWRGTDTSGSDRDDFVLYRGQDRGDGRYTEFSDAEEDREQVTAYLVDNPGGEPIFSRSGDVITIVLTTAASQQQLTLRTKVRLRNF